MKSYSGPIKQEQTIPLSIPVVQTLPDPLVSGQLVYKEDDLYPGLYIFKGNKRWVMIGSPVNNVFERHTATVDQKIFTLANSYPTDGRSLNVYVDGKRLRPDQIAEIGNTTVCIKEDGLILGGELVEFQIFNKFTEFTHDTVTRHVTYK